MEFVDSFFKELLEENNPFKKFIKDRTQANFVDFEEYSDYLFDKEGCYLANGISKGCFCFPKKGIVLKIPFSDFSNFCETEVENYKTAKEEGFDNFFAASWRETEIVIEDDFDEIKVPVYGMVFAKGLEEDEAYSYENRSFDYDSNYYNKFGLNQYDIVTLFNYFEDFYSSEILEELLFFLNENGINDIHGGNIGFIDNCPVLIDYSGV